MSSLTSHKCVASLKYSKIVCIHENFDANHLTINVGELFTAIEIERIISEEYLRISYL